MYKIAVLGIFKNKIFKRINKINLHCQLCGVTLQRVKYHSYKSLFKVETCNVKLLKY